jgi:putative ABC transport system ATP-binding protein
MSYIQIKNISKSFGKNKQTLVLDNINLEIESGESLAILGKSGSGKSTLLNIISGLIQPDSGEILYGGKSLFAKASKDPYKFRNQQIGLVFQAFYLQPNNTVFENVFLPLEIAGKISKKDKNRVMEVLDLVGLKDKFKEKTINLSGGQKQRVAIARSIVNNPSVIFADEPTGNLDSETGEQITEVLFNIQKTLKTTLIIVTHDHDLAEKCQKGIHIKNGKIASFDEFKKIIL